MLKAWADPCEHTEPCQWLFFKLKHTGWLLAKWSKGLFSKAKLHLHAALYIILHLDIAQETRPLSMAERDLRGLLKRRVISLASVERARKKQCARIANIREGDANTKYFHAYTNGRRRKCAILRLQSEHGLLLRQEDISRHIYEFYINLMGTCEDQRAGLRADV